MRKEPANQLNGRALTVWRISSSITMALFIFLCVGLIVISYIFPIPLWIGYSLLGLIVALSLFNIVFYSKLEWRKWKYEVHDSEVDIQHGVFTVQRSLIPMVRVQHVDTRQGPLLRRFNLATVTISTAATVHEIPALDVVEADQLRDRISQLARVTDYDE
ncbi:PH domain-containing protein [Bacillus sp. DJP31]|uniref:PH domain-containing protein n=1 Tax=Bacillus sp. DJP31 TaxID=3409789 RepID=UPI003BB6BE17